MHAGTTGQRHTETSKSPTSAISPTDRAKTARASASLPTPRYDVTVNSSLLIASRPRLVGKHCGYLSCKKWTSRSRT